MANLLESINARENALKSPEAAARYLNDQNDSSWVSDEEADTVIKSMNKFSSSPSDAKRFLSEWNEVRGGPIKLSTSTWTQSFKQKLDNIAFLGDKISKLASESANDIKKSVEQVEPVISQKEAQEAISKAGSFLSDLISSGQKTSATSNHMMYVSKSDVNARDPSKFSKVIGTVNKGDVVLFVNDISPGTLGFPKTPAFSEVVIEKFGGKKQVKAAIAKQYLSEVALLAETAKTGKPPAAKKPGSTLAKPDTAASPAAGYVSPSSSIMENKPLLAVAAIGIGFLAYKLIFPSQEPDSVDTKRK